jgi:hypothetical protein
MAHQTKYKDAIVNLPETSFSRHQKNHSKCNHMSIITYDKKKKGKSVKNYPVAIQVVFTLT